MTISCKKIKTALGRGLDAFYNILDRRYNFTFAVKRKKDAEAPLLRANFSGEIPKEWVAFLALIGLFTLLSALWKIIRFFRR